MRNLILSAVIFASAFQTALGQNFMDRVEGYWKYNILNDLQAQITGGYTGAVAQITGYTGPGGAVTIPSVLGGLPVKWLGNAWPPIFGDGNTSVTSVVVPDSVTYMSTPFYGCTSLTTIKMPDRFITQVHMSGVSGEVGTDYLINALASNDAFVTALASNDAFVTAVANKILAKIDNYGLAVKSELETLATYSELTTAIEPLATKTQITTAINEGKASGIASVTASPNTWSLFTTSQIQNMAVGDLVLTKNVGGTFTLNYDIEQSSDLQTWTTYAPLSLPLTGLPTDKAFVRIKVLNSTPNLPNSSPNPSDATPSTSNL